MTIKQTVLLMTSTSNFIRAMNNVTLEDEEEGGIAIEDMEDAEKSEMFNGFDPHLWLVGRFINEGVVDFMAMRHTLAYLWRPGK